MARGAQADRDRAGANAPRVLDWSVGHYESTADQLLPAAGVVVRSAALRTGERVLDLGCGTGNAALLAAEHSSRVTGVDPAERLLEVARARAAAEHKNVTFPGDPGRRERGPRQLPGHQSLHHRDRPPHAPPMS